MDLAHFKRSLQEPTPSVQLSPELRALWHAAKGAWDDAHKLVQDEKGRAAAWVHAHLHRIEGDLDNAGYWYRQAKRPASEQPLPAEWDEITGVLLRDPKG
ncbi:MAG: hypothetical protein EXQ98_05925 [Alphaproteobacteria bacterium]|nr:hypothetical protein [Alphaproteobacteria bacterium]